MTALAPGLLRIGGSMDTTVRYDFGGGDDGGWCRAPRAFRETNSTLCLTAARYDALHAFAERTGHRLVFGLSWPGVDGEHRRRLDAATVPAWNGSDAFSLLRYTRSRNNTLAAVELGEEMVPDPTSDSFQHLVAGYAALRAELGRLWPLSDDKASQKRPRLLGPCVGMYDESGGDPTCDPACVPSPFVRAFLNATRDHLDGMHSYDNDNGAGWTAPGFLSQTKRQATAMLDAARGVSPTLDVWCGECGPHNDGGVENVTDRFISSFYYADALGALAKLGFKEFGRQALVGSHYGLLDRVTLRPNPDFYVAALWSRVMGPAVLDAKTTLGAADVHVYAHCGRADGAVALAVVNISPDASFGLEAPPSARAQARSEWHLAARGGLLSKQLTLNGRPIAPDDFALEPRLAQPSDPVVIVAPYSVAFVLTPEADAPECRRRGRMMTPPLL